MATELGPALLATARNALERAFGKRGLAPAPCAAAEEIGAAFVTLTLAGELRGCIGTLEARRPLKIDVAQNALAAAFHDPRFEPLRAHELERTRIEVSVLSPPAPVAFADERDLLQRLHPGLDGVVLDWHGQRATFLPQVWEGLPTARAFMAALKRKAGLAADEWHDDVRILRYAVRQWKERDAIPIPMPT